jgi:7SK snRNA methylphosphate capping enzyme
MVVRCLLSGCRHTSSTFDDDPRLALLKEEWFARRHMLDVGCNEGLVTLAVATRFGCATTTGVDIDEALVQKAAR